MRTHDTNAALRQLPSVDGVIRDVRANYPPTIEEPFVAEAVRQVIQRTRSDILGGDANALARFRPRLDVMISLLVAGGLPAVINGTGVIVHTNLGRSPVSSATADAMAMASRNYLPLEVALESGNRGGRGAGLEALAGSLTGSEAALAVNNNAAAILLTLSALCSGKRVIVSRGEAVEIGGGFRIPDVMRQSGAILVEVGTTNRTNLSDYADEIDGDTAAILTVHASNFEISGFTQKPQLSHLANLAHEQGILLIEDVGSGCLVQTEEYGLAHEPTLAESIAAGVDIVTASGDKLLGGPQAGLVLGSKSAVDIVKRHPLARAVRTDKTVQAGLEATLRHYLRGEHNQEVPIWWMMSRSTDELRDRAESWRRQIANSRVGLTETTSVTGGGSLPGKTQPSVALLIDPDISSAAELARRLRLAPDPVFPRVEDDHVVIDARTVLPDQDDALIRTVKSVLE